MTENPERRWYQLSFSIRDLLWLTALVAVVLWSKYGTQEKPGRYLLHYDAGHSQTQFIDTATGACWKADGDGKWSSMMPPVSFKK